VATRWKSLAIRLALPLAMIGMTAIGAASPAHAEAEVSQVELPEVELFVPGPVVTTDGRSKTVPFEVTNVGKTAATGLVVDFASAASPIDPRIGFQPPTGCTPTGCTVGDLAPGARKTYTFTVRPTAELPEAGASFAVTVHDAGAEWRDSTTVTVLPAAQGVDLETAKIPDIKLAAGKSAVLPISVRNNGNKATEGVAIELAAQPFVTFPNNYSNCVDVDILPGIVCIFDLTLEPGAVFTMSASTPLTVAADAAAPGPAEYSSSMFALGLDDETKDANLAAAAKKVAKKIGTKLQLVPAAKSLAVDQGELNVWDNSTSFRIKVPLNPADSAAIGDNFEGKIGDISTVKIGVRNNGPATVLGPAKDWKYSAEVRTPSGLALTKVDKRCFPNGDGDPSWDKPGQISGHEYVCVANEWLAAGKQDLFSFSGKIQDGKNEDEGTIKVLGGVQDLNASNNTAKVNVKLTAGGSGSGSGGTGGGLPITGAPTGQIAGAGLLLVLTGALALLLTRRRRIV